MINNTPGDGSVTRDVRLLFSFLSAVPADTHTISSFRSLLLSLLGYPFGQKNLAEPITGGTLDVLVTSMNRVFEFVHVRVVFNTTSYPLAGTEEIIFCIFCICIYRDKSDQL